MCIYTTKKLSKNNRNNRNHVISIYIQACLQGETRSILRGTIQPEPTYSQYRLFVSIKGYIKEKRSIKKRGKKMGGGGVIYTSCHAIVIHQGCSF